MKKLNLLDRTEIKKVLGGYVMPEEEGGGTTCRFKYRSSPSEPWSNWSAPTEYQFGDCNSWRLTFIQQGSVNHCAYETVS